MNFNKELQRFRDRFSHTNCHEMVQMCDAILWCHFDEDHQETLHKIFTNISLYQKDIHENRPFKEMNAVIQLDSYFRNERDKSEALHFLDAYKKLGKKVAAQISPLPKESVVPLILWYDLFSAWVIVVPAEWLRSIELRMTIRSIAVSVQTPVKYVFGIHPNKAFYKDVWIAYDFINSVSKGVWSEFFFTHPLEEYTEEQICLLKNLKILPKE